MERDTDSERSSKESTIETEAGGDTVPPTQLRTEYAENPLGIETARPRFSWRFASNRRNHTQTAYRILVASTRKCLDANDGDVWDSGRVASARSINVEYRGPALDARTRYHWKVRIWDSNGTESAWSTPAYWEMGLTDESRWNATWIGAPSSSGNEQLPGDERTDYTLETHPGGEDVAAQDGSETVLRSNEFEGNPLFRKVLRFETEVCDARVYISGLGFYELYMNGERVGNRTLDPGRTDYQETVLYSTYDVTDRVRSGENVIGVALGRGRYGDRFRRIWDKQEIGWWSEPELRFQLHVDFRDGTNRMIVSDESWKVSGGPTLYDSFTPFNQRYDARRETSGWTESGYDDSEWMDASAVDGPAGEMVSQQVQPMKTLDTISPVEMTEPVPGTYVYDLGQMIAGRVELTVSGERGSTVTLTEGEQLANDGTVQEITFGGSEFLKQQYTLAGDGSETWEPGFSYGGFRYVQVEGYPGTPTLDSITGKVIHTAVDEGIECRFDSSNGLLDRIHENTRWAMLNNLHSIHTDTPTWEKLGWTEAQIEMGESLTYNLSMARFWTKYLNDCRDNQLESGDIHYTVPSPDAYSIEIGDRNDPGWDAAYVFTTWLTYNYYGDEQVIAKHYENLKRYVRYVEREADDGLIVRTGLGDYKPPGHRFPPEGPAIVSTALYFRSTQIMAEIADRLNNDGDAAEFRAMCSDIRRAFNDEFFDAETDVYRTGQADEYRQTSNVYPLAFDLVPDNHRAAVAKNLAENVVQDHDGHLNTGSLGLSYLLSVLTEHGHHDVAYTIVTRTTYPSWGYWIENDVTALLEAWELDARSRTHDFKGSIDRWFYQYLAGIREPVEPGFEHIEIAPEIPSDLEQASGTVETVRGPITSTWERTEEPARERDGFTMGVTVPGNTSATVRIPMLDSDNVHVRERSETIWNNENQLRPTHPGIETVQREDDRIVVEIGSGEYSFELEPIDRDD